MINKNQQIIDNLTFLYLYYQKIEDKYRSLAYRNAIKSIQNYTYPIQSEKEALSLPKIGKGIAKKIDELLKTGEIELIEKLKKTKEGQEIEFYKKLINIQGVGKKKASEWINKGYTNLNDILKNENLTSIQEKGILYYDDFQKRIPRDEITKIYKKIKKVLHNYDKNLKIEVAGSYRRELKTSGDIDLLITHSRKNIALPLFNKIIDILTQKKILIDQIKKGEMIYMGVIKLTGKPFRKIDIRIINKNEWPYALLYFTGSKDFNVWMRYIAKKMNYRLNEKDMYNKYTGNSIINNAKTEKDIFNSLNLDYIKPENREVPPKKTIFRKK
jgi:DNA polymerase/3'-5' exonuclease PolX